MNLFRKIFSGQGIEILPENGPASQRAEDRARQRLASAQKAGEDLYSSIGVSGNKFYRRQLVNQEYLTELRGVKGSKVYREMLSDTQAEAVNNIITLPIKGANWEPYAYAKADANGERKELSHIKARLVELKQRMNFPGLLHNALLHWAYGYVVMEKTWVRDKNGHWLKTPALRDHTTIVGWHREDGQLSGVEQFAWKESAVNSGTGAYKTILIPEVPSLRAARFKLLHIANKQEGDNFEGRSGLRAAYGPWFWKKELINILLIGYQRFAVGVPRAKLTKSWWDKIRNDVEDILAALQVGEQSYLVETEEVSFDILGHQNANRLDPKPFIDYCDESIAMAALAMALKLGTTQTGSRALGDVMFKMFLLSLEAVANNVMVAINEQIVSPWLELNESNWQNIDAGFQWFDLKPEDPGQVADALSKLTPSGLVSYDPQLENRLRQLLDLPSMPPYMLEVREQEIAEGNFREPPAQAQPAASGTAQATATGCNDPNHKHTFAAKREFWRELTDLEKMVSLREIDGRQDDAQEHIVELIRNDRKEWAASLRQQIKDAIDTGKVSSLGKVEVPVEMRNEATKEVIDVERDLFRYGRRTVADELNRQRKKAKKAMGITGEQIFRDEPHEPDEITDTFRHRAKEYLESLTRKARNLAVALATNLMRSKGTDVTKSDLDAIESLIIATFDQTARLESAVVVSESFNLGRAEEAKNQGVTKAIYSAILDENTCTVCLDSDGEEYDVGSAEYYAVTPPNPNCESTASGSNFCRCLWIYEMAA